MYLTLKNMDKIGKNEKSRMPTQPPIGLLMVRNLIGWLMAKWIFRCFAIRSVLDFVSERPSFSYLLLLPFFCFCLCICFCFCFFVFFPFKLINQIMGLNSWGNLSFLVTRLLICSFCRFTFFQIVQDGVCLIDIWMHKCWGCSSTDCCNSKFRGFSSTLEIKP